MRGTIALPTRLVVSFAIVLLLLPMAAANGQMSHGDSPLNDLNGATLTPLQVHEIDMTTLGISPAAVGDTLTQAPVSRDTNGATQNAFMSVAPSVVPPSTDSVVGIVASSFTPGESVKYFVVGSLAATLTADSNGRIGVSVNTSAGEGYVTVEAVGQSSGKRTGGVFAVSALAASAPGAAIAPHAINPTGSSTVNMMGTGYPPTTEVTIYRNGVALSTVTTSSKGRFYVGVPVAKTADTSAVYSAGTDAPGSLAGQSIEERADAGTPPEGDRNVSRAYFDRPIVPSIDGVTPVIIGEGFEPGEVVKFGGCGDSWSRAYPDGTVSWFLYLASGGGAVEQCAFHGDTSLRKAKATVQIDARALNVPSAINNPWTLPSGGQSFWFLFSRLPANETGTVYVDGVGQTTVTSGSDGQGAVRLTAPNIAGIHAVQFIGSESGRMAIAPLYILSADTTAPSVAAPVTELAYGLQLGTKKVPIHVSWSASDPAAVASYQLQQSTNGGSWSSISLPSSTSTAVTLYRAPRNTFRYRIRATDTHGNTSSWEPGPTFKLLARQESSSAISYSGSWTKRWPTSAYGGALKYSKSSTARAKFTFTGRAVAWVAPLNTKRGAADVYVDGAFARTVQLYANSAYPRTIVFVQSWDAVGTHTVEVRVRGTSDRPRVDVDAFLFLK